MIRVALLACLLLALPAQAETSVYSRTGVLLHLSDAQTAGGAGLALGLRKVFSDRFILQGDAGYLFLIGNALSLRVAGGVQRQGLWSPAALVTLTGAFGGRLVRLTTEHPAGPRMPAVALGAVLAPIRFRANGTTVSVLELGAGVGTDLPGLGTTIQITLLEIAARL